METIANSILSNEQITAWLRGLLTIAWCDGDFDEHEQELITQLTHSELASDLSIEALERPISPQDLAAALGTEGTIAENFLRTAVMVAIADGVYSPVEDEWLHQVCDALGQQFEPLQILRTTLEHPETGPAAASPVSSVAQPGHDHPFSPLKPLQEWLDHMEIHDPRVAHFLCKMIPPQCPFERDIQLFGHKVVHIPPLCKLNPLYEQLVGLRFRSLSYLADECGEDVAKYC